MDEVLGKDRKATLAQQLRQGLDSSGRRNTDEPQLLMTDKDRFSHPEVDTPGTWELIEELGRDLNLSLSGLNRNADQYTRRTAFRAAFPVVEALTYHLKQEALRDPSKYSPNELTLLREESYGLTASGQVTVGQRRVPSAENFMFAVRMAMRQCDRGFALDPDHPGCSAFKRAIRVRHRITHPKDYRSLHITSRELLTLIESLQWCYGLVWEYEEHVAGALRRAGEALEEILATLRRRGVGA